MPIDQKLIDTATRLEQQGQNAGSILDSIALSSSYQDVGQTIKDLRSQKMDDAEIYNHLKTAKIQNTQAKPMPSTSQPQSTMQKVGGAMTSAGEWMEGKRKEWTSPSSATTTVPEWGRNNPNAYATLGASREALGTVGEGLALGSNLTPVGLLTGGLKYAAVRQGESALDKMLGNKEETSLGTQLGEAVHDVGQGTAAQATLGAIPGMGGATKGAIKEVSSTIKDVNAMKKGSDTIDNAIQSTIKDIFPKAIKPPKSSVGASPAQREKYYDNVNNMVQDIVENKDNLTLLDNKGNVLEGQLPKSRENLLDAVGQEKERVFQQFNALQKEATESGAKGNITPLIDKFKEMAKNRLLPSQDPNMLRYLNKQVVELEKLQATGGLNPAELQSEIATLNAKLKPKASAIGYREFGLAYVDGVKATYYRNILDDTIMNATGEQYQPLKNLYGSLKTAEDDIARAANVATNTPKKGIYDLSDVWVGWHAAYAALTGNVAALGSSGIAYALKGRIKWLRDPDQNIKAMFEKTEKLMDMKKRISEPKSTMGKSLAAGTGATAVAGTALAADSEQPQQTDKPQMGTLGDPAAVPLIKLTKERDKAIANEDYDKAEKLEAQIAKIRAARK